MVEDTQATIVITAREFNPSIASQLWLVDRDIVGRNDFEPASVFSSEVSQTITKRFSLLILRPQLQFAPTDVEEAQWAPLAQQVVGKFVRALPETPYSAIGINFIVRLKPRSESPANFERRLFVRDDLPFAEDFSTDDCRFGGYFSKDAFGGRLKLDVKPTSIVNEGTHGPRLQMQFNFHRDLAASSRVDQIVEHLNNWTSMQEFSQQIAQKIKP